MHLDDEEGYDFDRIKAELDLLFSEGRHTSDDEGRLVELLTQLKFAVLPHRKDRPRKSFAGRRALASTANGQTQSGDGRNQE